MIDVDASWTDLSYMMMLMGSIVSSVGREWYLKKEFDGLRNVCSLSFADNWLSIARFMGI